MTSLDFVTNGNDGCPLLFQSRADCRGTPTRANAFTDKNFTTTVAFGRNHPGGANSDAYLAEALYQVGPDSVFTRIETVEKSGGELDLGQSLTNRTFRIGIGAYTLGYAHDLSHNQGIDVGVGGSVTVNSKPASLDPFYGGGTPVSFQLPLRLRPSKMGRMDKRGDGKSKAGMQGMQGIQGMYVSSSPALGRAAEGTNARRKPGGGGV